jgi:transposase
MTRCQKDPLRTLSQEEKQELERIGRSSSLPVAQVTRAKIILVVAEGMSYTAAAKSVGRRSNDAVSNLVSRFNREGVEAVVPRHGGGPETKYGEEAKSRILAELKREPDREKEGSATWSLSLLQKALRNAPDGLPAVSTYTIQKVLLEAGWRWQRDQSWCHTGTVLRKRKGELVEVTDPETDPKKLNRTGLSRGRSVGIASLDRR